MKNYLLIHQKLGLLGHLSLGDEDMSSFLRKKVKKNKDMVESAQNTYTPCTSNPLQ